REKPIPSLCDARIDVPAQLNAIYHRMVAKKPEDRYQTMAEVVVALEELLGGMSDTGETRTLAPGSTVTVRGSGGGTGGMSGGASGSGLLPLLSGERAGVRGDSLTVQPERPRPKVRPTTPSRAAGPTNRRLSPTRRAGGVSPLMGSRQAPSRPRCRLPA